MSADDVYLEAADKMEKAVGALLVLTGAAFLTGGFQSVSEWLIETFPTFGQ